MESQAEALGQLTTDDLDGKVGVSFTYYYYYFCTSVSCLPFINAFTSLDT